MGAIEPYLQRGTSNAMYDFYDGLAALLRIYEALSHRPQTPLTSWLPRAQGYLNVALKHLPEIGGDDYAQRSLAGQWRAGKILDSAVPMSARWLQAQLTVECGILAIYPSFYFVRDVLPEEAAVVEFLAQGRLAGD